MSFACITELKSISDNVHGSEKFVNRVTCRQVNKDLPSFTLKTLKPLDLIEVKISDFEFLDFRKYPSLQADPVFKKICI